MEYQFDYEDDIIDDNGILNIALDEFNRDLDNRTYNAEDFNYEFIKNDYCRWLED